MGEIEETRAIEMWSGNKSKRNRGIEELEEIGEIEEVEDIEADME